MYFVLFEIYVWLKPEIVLTEVTIKISTEFKPFYCITQGFNQCILIDGRNPFGLFISFEWRSWYEFKNLRFIEYVEHTIMKGYKLESFNIVFAV